MSFIDTLRPYYHYYKLIGPRGLGYLNKFKNGAPGELLEVNLPNLPHPIYVRNKTSDVATFEQVFLRGDYAIRGLPVENSSVIIDCGANCGMAAVFFANKYPGTRLFAIEPEFSNFEVLKKNVQNYPNITAIHAAIWNRNCKIQVVDAGNGNWGFSTRELLDGQYPNKNEFADAVSLDFLLEKFNIEKIDLLKIDIEGAEKELFQNNYEKWLPATKVMIIELHDHFKEGTAKTFFDALANYNYKLTISGENLVVVMK